MRVGYCLGCVCAGVGSRGGCPQRGKCKNYTCCFVSFCGAGKEGVGMEGGGGGAGEEQDGYWGKCTSFAKI